ncbi:MAG TPA: sulfatase-like hydrolase/transferase [Thermoanaerobaculia bacterium]|nr:sulfatase-like hydrolase/transferase [Thermoanaerobaculia bacterium]
MDSKKKNGFPASQLPGGGARVPPPASSGTNTEAPPPGRRPRETGRPGNRTRWLLAIAALAAIGGAAFFAWRARGSSEAPDIILVTIDTLRVDGVSFTGSTKAKTPFLDDLARKGIYFANAHSHNVVTFPSHTNILTGLLPYQHGVRDNAGFTLDPKHKSVAAYLKERGYATGAFVAAFPLDARVGLNAGFDVYNDEYPEGSAPNAFVVPERPAEEVLAPAVKWWDSVTDRKKFLWVHVYEPHVPYAPRSPFKEQYPDQPYYGEVAAVDDSLGKYLRPLLEKNPGALVIVTSDHGEGMGEHGEVTHGLFAYEETLHVPLILYQKGRIKPRVEKSFVNHIDIVPTIFAVLGLDQPKEMTGASLLDLKEPRNTYFESLTASLNLGWAPLFGMIHEGHKYVELPIAELYDLPRDPKEKSNILKENRRMTTRIRSLLAAAAPKANAEIERNVSPEEAKNLMALGYLAGTAAAKKTYTADDDPKTLVPFYARMNKAVMLYQEGKWDEAIDVAKKLLDDRPEMTLAKDLLAFVFQQTEKSGEAEKLLRDAMASGTASDTMKKRLGLLLSERGDAAEAVQILSTFRDSKDPELLNAYGIALADLGRMQEAIAQFERALQLDRTNAAAFQNLGVVALRMNDLPRAEQHLSRALRLNAKMPLALNSLGVVYARQNDVARAVDAWTRAVAVDPRQYDALFNIGLVAGRAGQRDRAKQALDQFVRTAPPERYARDIAVAKQALVALQ